MSADNRGVNEEVFPDCEACGSPLHVEDDGLGRSVYVSANGAIMCAARDGLRRHVVDGFSAGP